MPMIHMCFVCVCVCVRWCIIILKDGACVYLPAIVNTNLCPSIIEDYHNILMPSVSFFVTIEYSLV